MFPEELGMFPKDARTSWLNSGIKEGSSGSFCVSCALMVCSLTRRASKGQCGSLGHPVTFEASCIYFTI